MSSTDKTFDAYFIKVEGRILGPFGRNVLQSMLERGRITSAAEVSGDRNVWFELNKLGNNFAQTEHTTDVANPSDNQNHLGNHHAHPNVKYFYNLNGVRRGPVLLAELQSMAAIEKIGPNDLIWCEGQPNWIPSSMLADIRFPSGRQKARSWITQHPALFCFSVLLVLSIVAIPTYFVFASVRYRAGLTAQESDRARAVIDRLDKERAELFEQQRGLEQQSLTLDNIHEEMTLQYATQESAAVRLVTKQRLDDVDRRIAENARTQAEIAKSIDENRRQVAHECQTLGISPDANSGSLNDKPHPLKVDAK